MRTRLGQQSVEERREIGPRGGAREPQAERKAERACAHGGEVGEVHGEGLVTECARARGPKAEVDVLDERVRRDHELVAGARSEDRRVVADPQYPPRASGPRPTTQRPHEPLLPELPYIETAHDGKVTYSQVQGSFAE